ncbi:hypothetical protein V1517DRAFT_51979 [Lipomyces orientalis]|uniref:Uncharacterized protein n=1 Tax=Lipomyces orientalis TaxID=1233043 RepID=A0ACC3TGU7_9ASCO
MKKIMQYSQGMIWHNNKPRLSLSVDNSIVTAGSPVSGIVDLELDRPIIVDAITVRFRGISMTTELKYSAPSSYGGYISAQQNEVKEWHVHVDLTTMLFEGKRDAALPSGRYRLPFIVNIPIFSRCDCVTRLEEYRSRRHTHLWTCTGAVSRTVGDTPLPPSYEDKRGQYVRYEIMAVVDLPRKVEKISLVRNVIVIPVTLIHASDPGWSNFSRLAGATSDDSLTFTFKKVREISFQDGPTRQTDGRLRSFIIPQSKSHVQIPTKLQVSIANDGQASIMEPLKVQILIHLQANKILWADRPVNFTLTSMSVVMKSLTSRLTDIEKPVSVARNILYQGHALDIPLRAESASGSLGFRLDPDVFTDLDISKIVPSFYLLNLYHHHQLEVTVGFSLNGSSNRTVSCVCPIKVISGVDYDLDTERLMPPRYNTGQVRFKGEVLTL